MSLTDAEYWKVRNRMSDQVSLWKERLGLTPWRLSCYWWRTPAEFAAGAPEGVGNEAGACCDAKWMYLQAALHFNIESLATKYDDDEEREEVVVHELVHCLVDELYKTSPASDDNSPYEKGEWSGHNERVVTTLTQAYIRAYRYVPVAGEY